MANIDFDRWVCGLLPAGRATRFIASDASITKENVSEKLKEWRAARTRKKQAELLLIEKLLKPE